MGYNYEEFKKDIYNLTNINLSMYKEKQMKRRIESLMTRSRFSNFKEYYHALVRDEKLLKGFVSYLTINVSEFYRNPNQWEIFEKKIVPSIIKQFGTKINIWSAACSTGDEPYTIAMILAKYIPIENIHILATDLDEDVINYAKQGYYMKKSVERLPKELLKQYFVESKMGYQIKDDIMKCVEFRKHNLLEDPYPKGMHIIVCRNVVIYFTDEAKDKVYASFYNAMMKNGFLFIGNTEQIIHARELGFEVQDFFFYKK